jgi:enoyl-[acyl-carrier protein] reductase II
MFFPSKLCDLLNIEHPIIQAGMVWVSGANLAAAAANHGCLGVLGAGSMKPDLLKQQITKAKSLTSKSLAVNFPLLYPGVSEQMEVAYALGIRIFITSAGSPKTHTATLKSKNCVVIHVTSTPELALKCEAAGVDAVVAEGFEAGGHNGRDELTTMVLIPQVKDLLKIPVIAAGGIMDARGILAARALGADGVQMGTRFLATKESSAHENFKQAVVKASSCSTDLMMKSLVPVRLLKNQFYEEVKQLEKAGASAEQLSAHLGKGRARLGMLEGDLASGELEVGQGVGMINHVPTVKELIEELKSQYQKLKTTF